MTMKEIELMQSPGIIRDLPSHKLVDSAFSGGKNIRFAYNGAEVIQGDRQVLSEAGFTPLWLQAFPPITAPIWVYANLTEVWAINGSTHAEITRSASDYNAIAGERWQSTVMNGVGFFNNTQDVPQHWATFEETTLLVDLPNWDTNRRCKSLRSFKNFLVALNMTDSGVDRPYRVLWSSPADAGAIPSSWDSSDPSTAANEIDLAQTEDHLVDQLPMADINIIYKENSTWGMAYIGPPNHFRFWRILSHRGLLHRDCVVNYPGGHCLATQDDIVVHAAQTEQATSILDAKDRRAVFSSIDPDNFRNCFLFADNYTNEIWFCYPELGETYATMAVIWNWKTNSIGFRELTPTPFICVGPIGDSLIEDLIWDVIV